MLLLFSLVRPTARPADQHGMQDGAKREKEWEWRGTFWVGRVFVRKGTRESFHLRPINVEEHLNYKSEGLAGNILSAALDTLPHVPYI